MKHPLWILNSTLFGLLLVAFIFILFSRTQLPMLEELEPENYSPVIKQKTSDINIKKIYEHDLFGTYRKEFVDSKQPEPLAPFPEPPQPRPVKVPEEPKPQFLDPLGITLKGIISVTSDYTRNRAIIADTQTNKESIYKVGDIIEDAQLIKIFNQKVVFLRANGQQEIFYLREKDAQTDPTYLAIQGWDNIAQKVSPNNYLVSAPEFTQRVKNLAQFINLFDLTTIYKKGVSIGCRIGRKGQTALINQFGLMPDDIILSVNDIPANDTPNRLKIYHAVLDSHADETLVVTLLRNNIPVTIHLTLSELKSVDTTKPTAQKALTDRASKEQLEILHKRHSFAPTLQEIKDRERKNLNKGALPSKNHHPNVAE